MDVASYLLGQKSGGGSGGTSDYNELSNKPQINNVELSGNKTASDLGLVSPTDYASANTGGVIKVDNTYGVSLNQYKLMAIGTTYDNYQSLNNNAFISKGTLENVITGKQLVNQTYVDNLVGDINTILATLTTPSNGGNE